MKRILWPILSLVLMFLIPVIVVSTIAETIDGVFDFTNDNGTSTRFRLSERIVEKIYDTREVLNDSLLVVCAYQNIDDQSRLNDCFSASYLHQNQAGFSDDSLYDELEQIIADQGYSLFQGTIPHYEYLTDNLIYPVQSASNISSEYGFRVSPLTGDIEFHNAIDIAAEKYTPLHSFTSGQIIVVDKDETRGNYMIVESDNLLEYPDPECEVQDDGELICIYEVEPEDQHSVIVRTWYLHLNSFSSYGYVGAGQIIAEVGETGAVTGPHVHLSVEISIDGSPFQFVNTHLFLNP